ncbi:hypothetical protein Rhal01_00825 [Rubritalea halochordaticola]|uniref:HTH luxR-type domain-containing protein n=1 Tax=Rubritalea halochordaticola TaxID=714537 RepID=A0ABP9V202_9BACT
MNPKPHHSGPCICADDVEQIVQLWHDLHKFTALQADEAMEMFLGRMGEILHSCCGYWVAAASGKELASSMKTDLYDGYEAVDFIAMPGGLSHQEVDDRQAMYSQLSIKHGVCPIAVASVASRGETRAILRHDLMNDEEWEREWVYQKFYQVNDIGDRLVALYPVDSQSESCVVFDRKVDQDYYEARDRELLKLAMAGVGQLHRELMLLRGGVDNTSRLLTPRERDVLKLILTGDTEKEIAEHLGMGRSTLHHHVIAIYRKYNVRNRAGLQALWGRY